MCKNATTSAIYEEEGILYKRKEEVWQD